LTLFSADSILPQSHPKPLQRRRENVHRQLPLWCGAQEPDQETKIWQELDPQTKAVIIEMLSRLISKAVSPENLPDTKEVNDER
jgi:hypothetical protein